MAKLVRARRAEPRDDLLSALVQAQEAGEQLSDGEVVAMICLLLIAGHETTVNLIGNGVLALLEHPQQMEKLRSEPSLIVSAVEELLRYDSPLETATDRFATEDLAVGGVTIPRGDHRASELRLDIARQDLRWRSGLALRDPRSASLGNRLGNRALRGQRNLTARRGTP